jgi:hypothetical protein
VGQAAEQLLQSFQLDDSVNGEAVSKTDETIQALERMFKKGEIKE